MHDVPGRPRAGERGPASGEHPGRAAADRYGDGGVVAELEAEIAGLLGKPTAAFLPSGTMAQQSVLRVHADRRQRRTVVFHPTCHLHRREGQAFERLHDLTGRPAGDRHRPLSIGDLTAIAEPPAALLIELPQRDLGGQQPDWADLQAQVGWARGRGAAVHLDGARLWESAAGYGRPLREIADPFDTVYVSFYKGLGVLARCSRPARRTPRRGARVAAPHGRHAVRALAESRLRAQLPRAPAATDARIPQSRP